jgi:hypothetical protein
MILNERNTDIGNDLHSSSNIIEDEGCPRMGYSCMSTCDLISNKFLTLILLENLSLTFRVKHADCAKLALSLFAGQTLAH